MEEYRNNGSYGVNWKQMWAVDGKQEIYLEWPNLRANGIKNTVYTVVVYTLCSLETFAPTRPLYAEGNFFLPVLCFRR